MVTAKQARWTGMLLLLITFAAGGLVGAATLHVVEADEVPAPSATGMLSALSCRKFATLVLRAILRFSGRYSSQPRIVERIGGDCAVVGAAITSTSAKCLRAAAAISSIAILRTR